MPAFRRRLETTRPKSTSTAFALPAIDTERALQKYGAEICLQEARTMKAEAEKEAVTREKHRQARAEYKRLRDVLRNEEAEPERDKAFITVSKGPAVDALNSMKGYNSAPDT